MVSSQQVKQCGFPTQAFENFTYKRYSAIACDCNFAMKIGDALRTISNSYDGVFSQKYLPYLFSQKDSITGALIGS